MAGIIDSAIAARIVFLLTLPFIQWPAYKEGIIDETGTLLQQGAKSDNWTMLHRLVARLKILLGKIPGGKSFIATAAAAYLLVKEDLNGFETDMILEDRFQNALMRVNGSLSGHMLKENFQMLIEEGEAVPANNISNVAGIKPGDEPPGKKKKIMKRKELI